SRSDSKGCLRHRAGDYGLSAAPKLVTAMGRVLKAAPLACFLHHHRARESHGLTGQHRSHMVPDAVHATAMARFGGRVILKDTDGGHQGIVPIQWPQSLSTRSRIS